jgi:hypothetical protein
MLFRQLPFGLHHLHSSQAEALLLQALNDCSDQSALDAIGFEED